MHVRLPLCFFREGKKNLIGYEEYVMILSGKEIVLNTISI